ncbi:type VII secretion protein EccCa [Pseudoclavibacter chungangensis]|uniref:Type VII secretion protein EccCa n=1 Tax=Pseudoclavibacter chungangensis TaxID=587635 RepID=A0A7J5BPI5_9MICO|nr:type VII secretion protein EccCa [Pseudoclavibacter chungangensis]KAB1654840.1 type VII secretion protein EccCa [Pseudoclavibacter chungangensis]NYJ68037.1 S-DNA-T family DNA segregation ATPase FtsK/SpoIIIE [Pseudoclavibacter chungangensis]
MSTRIVHRPARVVRPPEPPLPTELAPPPRSADQQRGFPLQMLLPVIGAMSSVLMITVLRTNPLMVLVAALIFVVAVVSGVGMALSQRGQAARRRRDQRERFLDHLEDERERLRAVNAEVRREALLADPEPTALPDIVRDPARRWERRRTDADFLRLRIGLGPHDWHGLSLPKDSNPVEPFDELLADELAQLRRHYSIVRDLPATIGIDRVGDVSLVGPRSRTLALARSLYAQAVVFHAPDDLQIALVHAEHLAADWDGLDLAAHVQIDDVWDGPVRARRVAPTLERLASLIAPDLRGRSDTAAAARRGGGRSQDGFAAPRLLVFVDHGDATAGTLPVPDRTIGMRELGITVVHLVDDRLKEPGEVSVRVTSAEDEVTIDDVRTDAPRGAIRPDTTPPALATGIARATAPMRLSRADAREQGDAPDAVGVLESLGFDGLDDTHLRRAWLPRTERDFLTVPIGVDDSGRPVQLDLKESAQLGMGPHGIAVGATGSGKSELLRTLVLGLALTHSPDDLSMILVDYKGGAAFAPFTELPHVAGVIDNLADDPQLTRRAQTSIAGEVRRRQELLRDAGSLGSITAYRAQRAGTPDMPPMPHLLLVIDEFGELLTAEPDFVDLLLTIGRIGRSIGIHLLLSSQRVEQGKLRGLDTYLSYRIGLRTFSESESQLILETSDAFHLPALPGFGYLKVDTTQYTRFRAGYVSGPLPTEVEEAPVEERDEPLLLPRYNTIESDAAGRPEDEAEARLSAAAGGGRTVLDTAIELLRGAAEAVPPVWLAPLPERFAFERVRAAHRTGPLQAPIGLLDDPARQRQEPWLLDLTKLGGHVAAHGAPQTGRSTFLRTLATSLALTHTPAEVSIYGLDVSGGGLARVEPFPHVGGVATRADRERLARLLEELGTMLATRERIFRDHGIDSLGVLRARHARGELPELVSPDVVLLVDGLSILRAEFEQLEEPLMELLSRGGSFGLHVVLTMNRWNDLPLRHQAHIGQRLEFRVNDPMESQLGRKLADSMRNAGPGRAVTGESLFGQIALPVQEVVDDEEVGPELERLATRFAAGWSGATAAPIRLLPEHLDLDELPDPLEEPDRIPIGIRQSDLGAEFFDPARDQHLVAYGDAGAGKSSLLRVVAEGFMERYSSDELVIGVMDVRGQVAPAVPEDYLGGHASNARTATGLAAAIARELERRSDPEEAAKNPGPRVVLLIDDHHIIGSGGDDPLAPLIPHLPSARDLRLHVFLTRPVAGAARSSFELGIQTVRDTGGIGLVMSGDRSEGQIFPRVWAERMIPGRGRLVRPGRPPAVVHIAEPPLDAGGRNATDPGHEAPAPESSSTPPGEPHAT